MSETGKTLVDQQKFYEEPEYAYGVEDGDEDGNIVLDEEVSEDGEWIQTRIEQIPMIEMESMPDEQPSVEEMIRVRQLADLLHLEMAMQNLDMKPVPCVSQVTIKKTKDTKVVISNPTVFKVLNSDTYVILGNDAQTGNLSSLLQQPMVREASNHVAESESESDESESDEDDVDESGSEEDDVANSESDEVDESGSEEDDEDESGSSDDVDESGSSDDVDKSGSSDDVDGSESEEDDEDLSWYENLSWSEQEDIKLVTNHTGVSKRKAAKALKEFDGDIVPAIMELNSN